MGGYLFEQRQENVIDDEHPILRIRRNPGNVRRRESQVQRVQHRAGKGHAKITFKMDVMIPTQRCDSFSPVDAERLERMGQGMCSLRDMGVSMPNERLVRKSCYCLGVGEQLPGAIQDVMDGQRHAHNR
jgi:hypothetical protein